jgi:hypothetical protein
MNFLQKLYNKTTSNKVTNLSVEYRNYLITFIILLVLLRIFYINTFNITQHILNILLIFSILFMIFKNIKNAFIYTAGIIVVYAFLVYYVIRNNYGFENFENESEDEEKNKNNHSDDKDGLRAELDALIKKFEAQHKSGKSNIDTSKIEKYTDRLKGKIELKDDDTTENDPVGIDTSQMMHDEIKPDPLKKAQKETYELIDTIGILKETVQSLNPVLSEGKKVMDLFKGLNMDGLESDKVGEGDNGLGGLAALLGGNKEKK